VGGTLTLLAGKPGVFRAQKKIAHIFAKMWKEGFSSSLAASFAGSLLTHRRQNGYPNAENDHRSCTAKKP
jgi:hypothetical protein